MNRQVVYLMSGPAHLPYLVPSLYTLRQHWDGDVCVHAFPESWDYVQQVAADTQLGITAKLVEQPLRFKRGKNEQFINKIKLLQSLFADVVVYLDADTTIHGNIDLLFDRGWQSGFLATQFNRWLSTGSIIRNRLNRLLDCDKICQESLREVLTNAHPSLNGGVVACRPCSPVLPLWLDWSLSSQHVFICDEAVLHVLQAYVPKDQFGVVEGGRYNCSHKYQHEIEDVVIYHYHGDSNVRPDKSPKAYAMWWPLYQKCLELNVGNIQHWHHKIENGWITKLETNHA